jgi:hypothetical protein
MSSQDIAALLAERETLRQELATARRHLGIAFSALRLVLNTVPNATMPRPVAAADAAPTQATQLH